MSPGWPLLLSWLFLGCQQPQLPPSQDFQSIARGESGLPNLYGFIKDFHDSRFKGDPFERVIKTTIRQRQLPAPQQSEAAIETWTVESVSHRRYDYTMLVGVTREAGFETILVYEVIAINDDLYSQDWRGRSTASERRPEDCRKH